MVEIFIQSNLGGFSNRLLEIPKGISADQVKTILHQAVTTIVIDKAKSILQTQISNYEAKGPWGKKLTGALKASIAVLKTRGTRVRVGSPFKYAYYFEKGTGIYGPRHGYIHPKSAPALVWTGADGQKYAATKVSGMPPRPFMLPAIMSSWNELGAFIMARVNSLIKQKLFENKSK